APTPSPEDDTRKAGAESEDRLPIHVGLDDTQVAPKWDTGVPHAVPASRRAVPTSARVVAGATLVIAGLAGWLFHAPSKLTSKTEALGAVSSRPANGVPLASPGTAAATKATGPSTPATSDLAGIPATPEPSSAPSPTPSVGLPVAAAP